MRFKMAGGMGANMDGGQYSEDLRSSVVSTTAPSKSSGGMVESFSADHWSVLTDTQRVELCVEMAKEAGTFAQGSPEEMREQYLHLAQQWLNLANEISARNVPRIEAPQV